MGLEQMFISNPWITILIALWVLPWKGVALWKAAKNGSKPWFIALLILNTLGILEILYIFVFGKKKLVTPSVTPTNN
jgi:hypothetical protein